ncbi:hypothetical protein D3C76_794290 [compost metagenome]
MQDVVARKPVHLAARPVLVQQAHMSWQGDPVSRAADDQHALAVQARGVGQRVVHGQ